MLNHSGDLSVRFPLSLLKYMKSKRYEIGQIGLEYELDALSILEDEYTKNFQVEDFKKAQKIVRYQFTLSDFADKKQKPYTQGNGTFLRYHKGTSDEMIYHWVKLRYALAYDTADLKKIVNQQMITVPCRIHPLLAAQRPRMNMIRFMDYLGMHAIFLRNDHLLLHASYIIYKDQAILFTAPSQTGKSTQAELWKYYEGASIINGDRALIAKEEGSGWYAYGYPECGSSGITQNVSAPIRAIVVLEQAAQNQIEDMKAGQQLQALVSATKLWTWSMDQIDQAIETAGRVIQDLPVIKLKCRPDKDAVEILRAYLY